MIDIRSPRDVLRVLFIFRRDFVRAFVATVAILVVAAFVLPARFSSEARLMVKAGRENLSVPVDVSDGQTLAAQVSQRDPIVDEEQILTGRPIAAAVAREYLASSRTDRPSGGFVATLRGYVATASAATVDAVRAALVSVGLVDRVDETERLSRRLLERLKVSHVPGSAVVELTFSWNDPRVAQRILDAWVRAYLDERSRVLGRGSLVAFYEKKVDEAARQVDAYKLALQERLVRIDGTSARDRLDAIADRLNVVRARQADAAGELAGLKVGIGVSQARIARLPSEVLTEREVGPDTASVAVNTQLAELKRQRVDALRTFTESSPAIKAIDESIALVEARARGDARDALRVERRAPNAISTKLQGEAIEKSVRADELNAMVRAYETEAQSLSAERQRVMAAEPELAGIERSLAAAERTSARYLDNLEKARVDQALDESRINNVAVIEAATLDPTRVFPSSVALLLLAVPAGVVVGLLTVYVLAMLDQRIHDGSKVEARFGVTLWGTVKAVRGPADEDDGFDASIFRLASRLPLERIESRGLVVALTSARIGEGVHFVGERLHALLKAERVGVLVDPFEPRPLPGWLTLRLAPGLAESRAALSSLRDADLIVLVVDARASTVPMVENALQTLRSVFGRVDGIVVNRREFEVPPRLLRWLES